MRRERREDTRTWAPADDGVVIVDKPQGSTSHDVVAKMRYLARTRKVGHAGTLDPMATGVLVVGIGKATRLLTYIVGATKEYAATIRLGESTLTDDAEGERTGTGAVAAVTRDDVEREVRALTGEILQVPTAVSAIKVDGVRSYARVRAGEDVALAARPVTVSRFEVLDLRPAQTLDGAAVLDVDVVVECSSGTYVRALARDLGAALGVGGHLTALRRTRVGAFTLDSTEASTLEGFQAEAEDEGQVRVIPIATAAAGVLPVRPLTDTEATDLAFGRAVEASGVPGPHAAILGEGPTRRLVAIVEDARRHGTVAARPLTVFVDR